MEGDRPINYETAVGYPQTVGPLHENSADPSKKEDPVQIILHHAAWNGHEKTIRQVLKQEPNINSKADDGWTALHQATWNNHQAAVSCLLREGANPNDTDNEGETALHQAAWRGHSVLARLLLEHGADPNLRDKTGQTPLHHAASTGSTAVIRLILEAGADPRIEDNDERKPHSLAEENFHHACAKILRDKEKEIYGEEGLPDLANIPSTSHHAAELDSAIIDFLAVGKDTLSIELYGQASSSTPSKITINVDGEINTYFLKTGPDEHMFKGEYDSLAAIHKAVPSLCPRPLAYGDLRDSPGYFLLTEFIDIEDSHDGESSGLSLAQKLAQLHSTPSPIADSFSRPCFGFHIPTCVGQTLQNNPWNLSWAKFFAENRLRAVGKTVERIHGPDTELQSSLERIITEVVSRLLRDGHLGGTQGIQPSLVHGDLWSGNKTRGVIRGKGGTEDVVFDPGSCYAHSEYELGIMRMFGGFSSGFFNEYHRLMPKTEPVAEYDDRMGLYQLYQWLNHYALFAGDYRQDAMECVEKLVEKYGKKKEDECDDDYSSAIS
ncbi:MAG: hypothetical protein Q9168_005092 [Polycauliona sp. 1 TL-2023]